MNLLSTSVDRKQTASRGSLIAAVLFATLTAPCQAGTSSPTDLGGLVFYVVGLIVLIVLGFRSRFARFAAYAWFVLPLVLLLIAEQIERRGQVQTNARMKSETNAEKVTREPADDASVSTPPQARR